MDPSWCWFSVRQGQQTYPITHGDRQDLRCPVWLFCLVFSWWEMCSCSSVRSYNAAPGRCLMVAVLVRCWSFCCASSMVEFSLDAVCSLFLCFPSLSRVRKHMNSLPWLTSTWSISGRSNVRSCAIANFRFAVASFSVRNPLFGAKAEVMEGARL